MASASTLERQFATAVLRGVGVKPNTRSIANMLGWMRAEGGHTHNRARFNFLNTTQPAPGAGNTGSQGNIKVYRDFGQGVQATVQTLKNGRYGAIMGAFNSDPSTFSRAVNSTPWGTKSDFSSIIRSLVGAAPASVAPGAGPAVPPAAGTPGAADLAPAAGSLDVRRLMGILNAQRQRVLRGEMPGPGYQREIGRLVQGALSGARVKSAGQQVGAQVASAAQTVTGVPSGLTMGGGPEGHHSRALGNWQSDDAYDLMGKAGQSIYSPIGGTVVKISGQPGGKPGFAGYGITVRTPQGDLFFKHLGSANVKPGQRIKPGQLIGTLDPSTAGGPHLHLGGTNRGFLDQLAKMYTRR